jgi:esterase
MEIVDLAYEELGSQNSVPIIILHGFFASSRNWRKVAEKLAVSYRVYSLDLRNHGNSPHHPQLDYQVMVADVLSFMDAHSLESAHLLGHSMGGKCAMWLALNQPERTKKLIVVDIAPKSYKHNFDNTVQALIDLPLSEIKNRKQAETLLAERISELDYRQFLLQNLILKEGGYSWRVNLAIFKQMAPNIVAFPEINNLAGYRGETLFIAGKDSGYVLKDDISGLFPGATLKTIANAGHWVHAQQPEVFIEMVENFLQSG